MVNFAPTQCVPSRPPNGSKIFYPKLNPPDLGWKFTVVFIATRLNRPMK